MEAAFEMHFGGDENERVLESDFSGQRGKSSSSLSQPRYQPSDIHCSIAGGATGGKTMQNPCLHRAQSQGGWVTGKEADIVIAMQGFCMNSPTLCVFVTLRLMPVALS